MATLVQPLSSKNSNINYSEILKSNPYEGEFDVDYRSAKNINNIFKVIQKKNPEKAAKQFKSQKKNKNRLRKAVLWTSCATSLIVIAASVASIACIILGIVAAPVGIIALITTIIGGSAAVQAIYKMTKDTRTDIKLLHYNKTDAKIIFAQMNTAKAITEARRFKAKKLREEMASLKIKINNNDPNKEFYAERFLVLQEKNKEINAQLKEFYAVQDEVIKYFPTKSSTPPLNNNFDSDLNL